MRWRLALDWQLLLPILVIVILSLAALGSISLQLAFSQLLFFLLGVIGFIIFSRFDYRSHRYLVKFYALAVVVFLLLPFLFGAVTRGAIRWLQFGSLSLQSSELIKPFLIIIFASFLSQKSKPAPALLLTIYFFLLAIPALLIFKQPDLGSTLVVAAFWWAIFFAADLPLKYFIGTIAAALASLPLVWRFLAEYQKQRITAFLNPYADPRGSGYHLLQSIIAVGSGGFLGRGLGRGIQSQLRFLPESNTDFIFASLAEELGLLGSALLLIAYFLLLKRLLFIARQAPDNFSQLLTVGVFAMMLFQLLVNIGMNLGILPITGITLPLVSSGGSSLLATMISLGLVDNISRQQLPLKSLEIK